MTAVPPDPVSQTGSQQRQAWSDIGRRRATIDAARWHMRLRAATIRDGKIAPERRKVGGSTPAPDHTIYTVLTWANESWVSSTPAPLSDR